MIKSDTKHLPWKFKKGDGIHYRKSSSAERKALHQMLDDLGYDMYIPTNDRDWLSYEHNSFCFDDDEWLSADDSLIVHHDFLWWKQRLFPEQIDWPTNTFLDKQLENYEKKKLGS